ncbi:hypothetical protein HYG77_04940 [Rhodococcus sp. ZPP]|uniref:hypothetical protein n=1 Tax=Rhodococcus sp. ZPP TaxID=2749906 RepID=UPI001AD865A5|nr:hypothetical protein [Rhodococcus sp. ZPP]QTJ65009.1 hypothetical protein HYG77_04940 [Rhodococcus sp. ZPP]
MNDPKAQFDAETTEHVMTVLRDDGVYRHLVFARPGTGIWRFDLITWPGNLVITGDLESYHFAREHDMVDFFAAGRGINPDYWGEKVRGRTKLKRYSPEQFKQQVIAQFMEDRHYLPGPNLPLWQAIRSEVLAYADDGEHEARRALDNFRRQNYTFYDVWEWDFRDWDHHYLLCCHAIRWGVAKYRAEVTARAA